MNDLPEAVMDRLALEGAMIKQAFMTYGIDGSRIYKINVLTSDAHEQTLFLGCLLYTSRLKVMSGSIIRSASATILP